jgi:RES domain-containing protein
MLAGGRWNSPGRAVVYLAESVSLAVLENLVHMAREDFPTGYVVVSASMPESVSVRTEAQLRAHFPRAAATSQELGD